MNWRKKLGETLGHRITLLMIPHAEWRPFRLQFSAAFLVFLAGLWGCLTLWAGFIVGRHVDYWVTKADNQVMMVKLSHLEAEMEQSRNVLDMAQATDHELRGLLALASRHEETGMGGPTAADRAALKTMLISGGQNLNENLWHRQIRALQEDAARQLASFQEISWYLSNERSLYNATPNMWPTQGKITSPFGYRVDPIRADEGDLGEFHSGLDIANHPDTMIYATADGTVRVSDWSHGYGRMILIDHGFGYMTLYGHTAKALVQAGDHVRRGQAIAYMGTTGRSTGAHLHYEVWVHGRPVNPKPFLNTRPFRGLLVAEDVPTDNETER